MSILNIILKCDLTNDMMVSKKPDNSLAKSLLTTEPIIEKVVDGHLVYIYQDPYDVSESWDFSLYIPGKNFDGLYVKVPSKFYVTGCVSENSDGEVGIKKLHCTEQDVRDWVDGAAVFEAHIEEVEETRGAMEMDELDTGDPGYDEYEDGWW